FDSFILFPGQTKTVTDYYQDYVYNEATMEYQYETVAYTYQDEKPGFGLLMPGVRWHQAEGKAFQFGFAAIAANGEILQIPIPTVQWYRSL
ncbi:MAG: hypothetical protein HKN32_09310, partial [Flavobacteriales bacterium]|nr:hypothetical protein [Flavobacteriales bacterium]